MTEEYRPEFHAYLGRNPIQPDTNRVVIPHQVIEEPFNIIDTRQPIHWILIEPEARICLSPSPEIIGSTRSLTTTKVQGNRLTTIPKQFFPDYEGKAKYAQEMPERLQFRYGETLHFYTTEILLRWNAVYILKDKDGRQMFDEYWDDEYRSDGGAKDLVLEGEEINPADVLILEQGRSVSSEEAYELLSEPFELEDIDVPTIDKTPKSAESDIDEATGPEENKSDQERTQ